MSRVPYPTHCDRCGAKFGTSTMSRFNTDTVCMACLEREKAHPLYPEAVRVERDAVMHGNYNFPGIGCPPDLYGPPKERS